MLSNSYFIPRLTPIVIRTPYYNNNAFDSDSNHNDNNSIVFISIVANLKNAI
jgi:hypothetical protein